MTHRTFGSLARVAFAVVVLLAFAFAALAVSPAKHQPGQSVAVTASQVHAPPADQIAIEAQAFTLEQDLTLTVATPQTVASIKPTAANIDGRARPPNNTSEANGLTSNRPQPATVMRS